MVTSALAGKRILLTRAAHQNFELERLILKQSAIPVLFPCLEVQELTQSLHAGLSKLKEFGDVLFTSANAVQSLVRLLQPECSLKETLAGKRIAAVGVQTAAALKAHGVGIDLLPAIPSQDGLIDAYRKAGLPEQGLLFFRAEEGRDRLSNELTRMGITVSMIPAYRTVCPNEDVSEVVNMLKHNAIDAVLLGSPKAAHHFRLRINDLELANRPVIAAISEKLARTVQREGLDVQVVAKNASFEAMLDALSKHFASTNNE